MVRVYAEKKNSFINVNISGKAVYMRDISIEYYTIIKFDTFKPLPALSGIFIDRFRDVKTVCFLGWKNKEICSI
jgi:hypothetical protein